MTKAQRYDNLIPNGIPRWIRCYDNKGETFDRYTVVFTRTNDRICHYVGMSEKPFDPQGFGQHGESDEAIDRPRYSHLGKKIKWEDLPLDCQEVVFRDYKALHSLY